MPDISNSDNLIDSRDVIARIQELQDEFDAQEISIENGAEGQYNFDTNPDGDLVIDMATCGECGKSWNDALMSSRTPAPSARCPYEALHEELRELKTLTDLQDEAEPYAADWRHGETLIHEDYFKEYAQQLADDLGATKDDSWPGRHIDWDAAADELKQDYTTVDFDGTTYYIR